MTSIDAYMLIRASASGIPLGDATLMSYLTVNPKTADVRLVRTALERDSLRDEALAVLSLDLLAETIASLRGEIQVEVLKSSKRRSKLLSKMLSSKTALDQIVVDYLLDKPSMVSLREFIRLNQTLAVENRNRTADVVQAAFTLLAKYSEVTVDNWGIWPRKDFATYAELVRHAVVSRRIKSYNSRKSVAIMQVSLVAGLSEAKDWEDLVAVVDRQQGVNAAQQLEQAKEIAQELQDGVVTHSLGAKWIMDGILLSDDVALYLRRCSAREMAAGLRSGLTFAQAVEAGADVNELLSALPRPAFRSVVIPRDRLLHDVGRASEAVYFSSRHSGETTASSLFEYAAEAIGDSSDAWRFFWDELPRWESSFSDLVHTSVAVS